MVPDETVTSGDPCRCPRMALSSSGALPRTSGSLCVQSGTNSSTFFLLKAIFSVDCTQSRLLCDLQWRVRVVYWKRQSKAFNACSISQPHTTVDATLCSTRRPAAAFRCTPHATAASSPALATVCEAIDTVSGVETDVSHNVRECRDGMFIAFYAHFVVFFTVHSWEEDARGKSHSCLFTDPSVSPILVDLRFFSKRVPVLRNRIKRACVLVKRINGKINLNRVFRLRWLCGGRACRVQPFMLSLSVFL